MDLHALLREAADLQATDLYLIAGAVPCISIEGQFVAPRAANNQRLAPADLEHFARQIMAPRQWEEFEETKECNMAYMTPEVGRYRVNVLRQRGSIGMVMRRVVMQIPTMRELGLLPILREVALADRGIVVVTGSTGSGKSTTMASMIDYRNHLRSGHIVTIEDPIEFVYQHRRSIVTQREVGMDTEGFHEALKNSLRQAPSVISIGEMRDAATVEFALHAAETGHLVFATLHSTNAIVTVERILHFFPASSRDMIHMQLAMNLRAVICQRLPRHADGRRRVCAQEVLLATPRVQDLVARGEMPELRVALAAENNVGMQNFDRSLYHLFRRGIITREEALMNSDSPDELQMRLKGIGVDEASSWARFEDPWVQIAEDYGVPGASDTGSRIYDPSATGGYTNEGAAPSARGSSDGVRIPARGVSTPAPAAPRTPPPVQPRTPPPPRPAAATPMPPPAEGGSVADRYRHMIDNAVESKPGLDEFDSIDIDELERELD